ncbi:MAG: hypothetical protein LBM18_00765 [Oscillospiraceae bacterium]|jgi:hypothetical protein|nr:hypothetical protein [Oscillospiraceae bacterium]
MGVFKKKRDAGGAGAATQIRSVGAHPFGVLNNYVPLGGGDTRLYRAIREAVPVVDAAIMKLIRLCGGFEIACSDKRSERELNEFLRTVDAGRAQRGIGAFLDNYLDSMLTAGRAVGEIVTDGNRDIAAVLCGNVCDVQIKEGATPLDFVFCGAGVAGLVEPLPYQELILFTPFNPEADNPLWGVADEEYAVFDGHFAQDLSVDRAQLGAGGQCALRRGL